jgi:hypothetical protein
MLIRSTTLAMIAAGEVTLAFRRWVRPTVRAGGTLTTAIGVLAIDAVDPISTDAITAAEARHAGYATRKALIDELDRRDGDLYRIELRLLGEDPRIALRKTADLSGTDLDEVLVRLQRMDRASRTGAWTQATLETIEAHPARAARHLSGKVGLDRDPFKTNVRKLKNLGLTESLEVGYRLSPRGEVVLRALRTRSCS